MFNQRKGIAIVGLMIVVLLTQLGCTGSTGAAEGDVEDAVVEGVVEEVDEEEQEKIVVGTSGEYYPWAFQKDGVLQGFEIDVWNEIAKRNNLEISFETSRFSGLIGMLDTGRIDTIAHQMSITEERKEKYNFTEPYAYSYYDFAVRSDNTMESLDDLIGKSVGCWQGGNGERTLRAINDEHNLNLDIRTYDGVPIEQEVELGRLDASWQGEVKTLATIEKNNLDLKLLDIKLVFETNAYPFVKGSEKDALREDISKTIRDMHQDGTLSNFSKKWFDLDTTVKP
ncbi:transporter substrate-binding domain-containing protein [Alkaliphilus peptidifermentans]|uniref:Putative amino-acid transport system substrate-binding protein n=1 Tax=Alkaliphilus peptidifermentans DSM 18978 TaxID=1120976 RepID=A0A1G5IAD8_9FIRM|nr:transporter substrate-binding domain-containing protein [Alkaliphilus peptidifermentans]SCY73115.1 putative amino-acid transport system substrate-binding protein [Alkaliphilus peptidifermentans DSM 18978]